jgi:hypothetical protein
MSDAGRHRASTAMLSGADWWHANQHKYPNSSEISDLTPAFATAVGAFIRALEAAGATVVVTTTLRHHLRAYLMHYSWQVANGEIEARRVPLERDVPIIWDHGNEEASRSAAREMLALFGIVHPASLISNHIRGKAVDMKIRWTDAMLVRNGRGHNVRIDRPRNDASNSDLHAIGDTYGVRKLLKDAPHWSHNGH